MESPRVLTTSFEDCPARSTLKGGGWGDICPLLLCLIPCRLQNFSISRACVQGLQPSSLQCSSLRYQNTFNHSSHTISNQAHSTSLLQSQGDPHYGLTSHYHTPQSAASIISDDSVYSFKRRMDISSQLHAAMHGNMHMNHNHEEIPPIKKTRTNTPWTPDEEKRLKELRDVGTTWSEIAKVCDSIQHFIHSKLLMVSFLSHFLIVLKEV